MERDGTHGSSHHVVYQRHFILIFREGGRGKGLQWWRREKERETEKRAREGGGASKVEREKGAERQKGTERPVLRR